MFIINIDGVTHSQKGKYKGQLKYSNIEPILLTINARFQMVEAEN